LYPKEIIYFVNLSNHAQILEGSPCKSLILKLHQEIYFLHSTGVTFNQNKLPEQEQIEIYSSSL